MDHHHLLIQVKISKFVKNVKIATEIEPAIFPSNPFIFEMLSNLNEKW